MRRRSRNPGDGLPLILGGVLVSGAAVAALLWWGSRNAAASPGSKPAPAGGGPEPVGFFPGLKLGDMLEVDPVAANIPHADGVSVVICVVDMVLTDPAVISVTAIAGPSLVPFRGTIPRSSIRRVLVTPPPGVFV